MIKIEEMEKLINTKAIIKKYGLEYLTLESALEIIETCMNNNLAILGIDSFRDEGSGETGNLGIIADYSPSRSPEVCLPWSEFQPMANKSAVNFINNLYDIQKNENIRILVEILVQEPY